MPADHAHMCNGPLRITTSSEGRSVSAPRIETQQVRVEQALSGSGHCCHGGEWRTPSNGSRTFNLMSCHAGHGIGHTWHRGRARPFAAFESRILSGLNIALCFGRDPV